METTYLGLSLRSPVVVASSPFTANWEGVLRSAEAGAGAVVLKSVFEEQIDREAEALLRTEDAPEARDYLRGYLGSDYLDRHLELIRKAHEHAGIPVIGSVNALPRSGAWAGYAALMAQAGADALELNLMRVPTRPATRAEELLGELYDAVGTVTRTAGIPVSVKLSRYYTNLVAVADSLRALGCRGVVLFNRPFEPDIDIDRIALVAADPYAAPLAIADSLRFIALTASAVPEMDVAASSGVHTGSDAVKAILAGAAAVQLCTAIHRDGFAAIGVVDRFLTEWAFDHNFVTTADFRGLCDYGRTDADGLYQRVQYMKYFPREVYPPLGH